MLYGSGNYVYSIGGKPVSEATAGMYRFTFDSDYPESATSWGSGWWMDSMELAGPATSNGAFYNKSPNVFEYDPPIPPYSLPYTGQYSPIENMTLYPCFQGQYGRTGAFTRSNTDGNYYGVVSRIPLYRSPADVGVRSLNPVCMFASASSITSYRGVASTGMLSYCPSLKYADLYYDSNDYFNLNYVCEGASSLESASIISTGGYVHAQSAFNGCINLRTAKIYAGDGYQETSEIVDLAGAFNGCSSLVDVDVQFTGTKAIGLYQAFFGCHSLTSFPNIPFTACDSAAWSQTIGDTMRYTFYNCSSISGDIDIDFRNAGSHAPTSWLSTFEGMSNIENATLHFSGNVNANLERTFYSCPSLKKVVIDPISSVSSLDGTFGYCGDSLIDFDYENYTGIHCSRLYVGTTRSSIDLSIGTNAVVTAASSMAMNMEAMLAVAPNLESAKIRIRTPGNRVLTAERMFESCPALQDAEIQFNTSRNVGIGTRIRMNGMFNGCGSLTSFRQTILAQSAGTNVISGLTATSVYNAFQNCSSLENVRFCKVSADDITNMFAGCSNLTSINGYTSLSSYIGSLLISNPTYHDGAFYGCSAFPDYEELSADPVYSSWCAYPEDNS